MAKSADAFRTISEVAEWLDTPAHVLRFWESKFPQVKPVKRAGGRRYYRPSDMQLLGGIKQLLHNDGMTIKGVQKLLREQGVRHVASHSPALGVEDAGPQESDITAKASEARPEDEPRGRLLTFPSADEARPVEDAPQADEAPAPAAGQAASPASPESAAQAESDIAAGAEETPAPPAPPRADDAGDTPPAADPAAEPAERPGTGDAAAQAELPSFSRAASASAPEETRPAAEAPEPETAEIAPAPEAPEPELVAPGSDPSETRPTTSEPAASEAPAPRARVVDTPADPDDTPDAPPGLLALLPRVRMPIEDARAAELSTLLSRLAALRAGMAEQRKE